MSEPLTQREREEREREERINNYINGITSIPSHDDIREWGSLENPKSMQRRTLRNIRKIIKNAENSNIKIKGITGIVARCIELNNIYEQIIKTPRYSPIPIRNTSLARPPFKFTPKRSVKTKRSVKK